jgi:hypothetical protein
MRTPPDKSRPISPVTVILIGFAGLLLDAFFVWRTIAGLLAGKVHSLGRGVHTLVFEQDDRRMFWFQISGHFLVKIMFAVGAACLVVIGFRQLRQ